MGQLREVWAAGGHTPFPTQPAFVFITCSIRKDATPLSWLGLTLLGLNDAGNSYYLP